MRILGPRVHGYIDIAVILIFLVGPLLFGLGGTPALISWILAIAYLILTLLTRYPLGMAKKIPFFGHGIIELAFAVFVAVLPRLDGYSPGSPARRFYWTMAIVLGVVWLLTDYREREAATA
jgi:hypothetical protein